MVDKILGAPFGGPSHRLLRLTFGADKKHAPAARDGVAHREQRLVQQRHRLSQIHDMNVVADPENIRGHLRIPPLGAVTEMSA